MEEKRDRNLEFFARCGEGEELVSVEGDVVGSIFCSYEIEAADEMGEFQFEIEALFEFLLHPLARNASRRAVDDFDAEGKKVQLMSGSQFNFFLFELFTYDGHLLDMVEPVDTVVGGNISIEQHGAQFRIHYLVPDHAIDCGADVPAIDGLVVDQSFERSSALVEARPDSIGRPWIGIRLTSRENHLVTHPLLRSIEPGIVGGGRIFNVHVLRKATAEVSPEHPSCCRIDSSSPMFRIISRRKDVTGYSISGKNIKGNLTIIEICERKERLRTPNEHGILDRCTSRMG